MARIPTLVTDVFLCGDDNSRTPAGRVDLTPAIAEVLCCQPDLLESWVNGEMPLVSNVASALDQTMYRAASEGKLAMPSFGKDVAAFAETLGGTWRLHELAKVMKDVKDSRWALERAERELRLITAARWEEDLGKFEMFYGDWVDNDYVSDPGTATDSWGWDIYEKLDPRPTDLDWESPPYKAWEARYDAWKRAHCPPYLYGTASTSWPGLDAADIREHVEDEEITDVHKLWGVMDDLLECGLEEHHEDARESVKDEEELGAILAAWLPHAGQGTPEDLALEEKVAAWNAKQTITSFSADETVAVPAFEGVTHAEAIGHCQRMVDEARQAQEEALDAWEAEPPLVAYADQLEPFYKRLAKVRLLSVETWPLADGGITVNALFRGRGEFSIVIAERQLGLDWVNRRLAGEPNVRVIHHDQPMETLESVDVTPL